MGTAAAAGVLWLLATLADVIVAGHADKLKRPRIVTKTDEVFATTLLSAVVLLGACAVGGALFARAR